MIARRLRSKDADQPLDRLRQPGAALVIAGLLGQLGNRSCSERAASRKKRSSLVTPMITCATASVTTSASVTIHRAFLARSGRRSSAVQKTAVRSRSRSASIVAPLRVDVAELGSADFDLRLTSPSATSVQTERNSPVHRWARTYVRPMDKTDTALILSALSVALALGIGPVASALLAGYLAGTLTTSRWRGP